MFSERAFQIVAGLSWFERSAEPTRLADQLVATAAGSVAVTGVGLAWMDAGLPGVLVAATDEGARRVEELQFTLGEGPCATAAVRHRPVLVEDLAGRQGSEWPGFTAGAVEAGVAAVFAFPLELGGVTFGVLDFYRNAPGSLSPADLAEAGALATVGTWVLMHLQPGIADEDRFPDLTERLADRLQVHTAAGVLAQRLGLPVGDALNILRARAFAKGRPISELAQAVLAGTETFPPVTPLPPERSR